MYQMSVQTFKLPKGQRAMGKGQKKKRQAFKLADKISL
jgi:hypothetical protein